MVTMRRSVRAGVLTALAFWAVAVLCQAAARADEKSADSERRVRTGTGKYITEKNCDERVRLKVGDFLVVNLQAVAGDDWHLTTVPTTLQLTDSFELTPIPIGVIQRVFIFKAVSDGNQELVVEDRQGSTVIKTCRFHVDVSH
jgi:hypothetical protein